MDRLKHTLHICGQAAPQADYADVAGFAREPSRTCFVASAKAAISSSGVKEAVLPWLEAAGFKDDQWQIVGAPGLASKHVVHAHKALKLPDGGGWRKFETRDAESQVQELFISLDKNGSRSAARSSATNFSSSSRALTSQDAGGPTVPRELRFEPRPLRSASSPQMVPRRRLLWSGIIVLSMMLVWTRMPWFLPSTTYSGKPRKLHGVFSRRFAPWKAP
eukprot:7011257-Pyramimonas_sp.AAC.1